MTEKGDVAPPPQLALVPSPSPSPPKLNLNVVRGVLHKCRESTNLTLMLLLASVLAYACVVPVAIKDVPGEGAAAHFRFQNAVVVLGLFIVVVFLITISNWFALDKLARAIDTVFPPPPPYGATAKLKKH